MYFPMCGQVLDHGSVPGRFIKDGGCHDTGGKAAGGMRVVVQAQDLNCPGVKMEDDGTGGVIGWVIPGDVVVIG